MTNKTWKGFLRSHIGEVGVRLFLRLNTSSPRATLHGIRQQGWEEDWGDTFRDLRDRFVEGRGRAVEHAECDWETIGEGCFRRKRHGDSSMQMVAT